MRAKRPLFLGLGSNLGDRKDSLVRAKYGLERELGPVIKASQYYETAAWGKIDQSDFLNQVIVLECRLTPHEVLRKVLRQELKMGRVRQDKWGARSIDIDLLFYGELICEMNDLSLPHPYISERRFILAPLVELAPNFIHPILNKSMQTLLQQCADHSAVNLFDQ